MEKYLSKIFVGLAALAILFGANVALGNPANLSVQYQDEASQSTTTIAYMTPGVGTTTKSFFTQNSDQLDLNIMMVASSTQSQLNYRLESSQNNLDWYAWSNTLTSNATTTQVTGDFAEYNWRFASSTGGTGTLTRGFKHVTFTNISAKYTRVVFYVPIGAFNAGVNVYGVVKEQIK